MAYTILKQCCHPRCSHNNYTTPHSVADTRPNPPFQLRRTSAIVWPRFSGNSARKRIDWDRWVALRRPDGGPAHSIGGARNERPPWAGAGAWRFPFCCHRHDSHLIKGGGVVVLEILFNRVFLPNSGNIDCICDLPWFVIKSAKFQMNSPMKNPSSRSSSKARKWRASNCTWYSSDQTNEGNCVNWNGTQCYKLI